MESGGVTEQEELVGEEDVDALLRWKTGAIALPGGKATLALGEGFRYLDPAQARTVLEDLWGNPPGPKTLGMVFPADLGPLSEEGWGVVLTYVEEGHVPDGDAGEIDYDELLASMQAETREENAERSRAGFGSIEIVGWAAPPHYDARAHTLYWARELRFDGVPDTTLNYDVRVLGREGVLSMNAVASTDDLSTVRQGMDALLGSVAFTQGNRYEDYDSSVDELAAYGIGGLIAGKVAAKVGLWKVLVGGLLAAKKFLIVALVGIGGLVSRLVRRNRAAA